MSSYHIKPSRLRGEITIPSSKSQTLRAILFGALAQGKSSICDYLPSPDAQAMIRACRLFGAKLEATKEKIEIVGLGGRISYAEDVIDAGNSGITLRNCAAVAALAVHPVVITGDESIRRQRPMQPLLEALSQLGVATKTGRGDGFAPIIVQGPIKPGKTVVLGEDSQPVSALLIAAAFAEGPIEIEVLKAGEKPWVALTLDWLKRLGIPFKADGFDHFALQGRCRYPGFEYQVPGDMSSAAFPLAAALVTQSELLLKNVDMQDCQGDKELVFVLQKMGAKIDIDERKRTLFVHKGSRLNGMSVDINDFIDALPILSVVACFAEGETLIRNAHAARHKECNRIRCMAEELQKMGADIAETEDGLRIRGSPLTGAEVHSHQDHRLLMALAVAGLAAKNETRVSSAECVSKTFPTFQSAFKALGAHIEEHP